MGDAFKETYSPRVPAELTYIVVIGDSGKLKLEESVESSSGLIDLPIRGNLAASRESQNHGNRGLISKASHGLRRNAVVSTVSRGPIETRSERRR